MPAIHPFTPLQYLAGRGDASALVAPPYDVLDAASKQRLLARDARNIVAVDLPHTPAKELGPPAAYDAAARTYRAWIAERVLQRAARPAIYAYRQTFASTDGRTHQRHGMAVCVDAVPFSAEPAAASAGVGGRILPHEETFSGPKQDRLALMRATRAQLSPIFGLFADDSGRGTAIVHRACAARPADQTATTADGTRHEVWTIDDPATIADYQAALAREDIYIADGHHRYTTQLNYLAELGPAAAPGHPARRCMMVLVGMSDPGLVIWPTHRVLGGMASYSWDRVVAAAPSCLRLEPVSGSLADIARTLEARADLGEPRVAIIDASHSPGRPRAALATPADVAALAARAPGKPRAWLELDVSLVQLAVVEQLAQPVLNGGQPVRWAFPHTLAEVEQILRGDETGAGGGAGFTPQLVVLVRPTPLAAVRDVARAGHTMPQKSTFFYPKLATGLFVNPLE